MDNKKIIIIGGGFTSLVLKLVIPNSIVLSSNYSGDKKKYRKNLSIEKIFSYKNKSYGDLEYKLKTSILHDMPILGGNSNIWGGFINLSEIPNSFIKFLKENKVYTTKLSFTNTGSVANKNIHQLRDVNNNILNVKNLKIQSEDCFVEKLDTTGNFVKVQTTDNKIYKAAKVYLATGVVQTLDLLYRSGYLENGSKITLDEYEHKLSVKFTFRKNYFNEESEESTIIRFNLLVALKHFLGIQGNIKLIGLFNWIPIYIEQKFSKKNSKLKLKLDKNIFIEEIESINFGRSIHYCNLTINEVPIRKYLEKIHKKIDGSGMAFIKQKGPGPISNDIILDILKKIV